MLFLGHPRGGGWAAVGAAAPVCGLSRSTETHVRVAPVSSSSFFGSLIRTRYGLQYVASRSPMTAPSRT